MNLDEMLSQAIQEGKRALEAKKQAKRGPSIQERRAAAAKLLTKDVEREVVAVHRGTFEITCLVAEYVRRTCKTCGFSELCAVPRVFICEQQVGVPSTRRLHRMNNQETVHGYVKRGLPVKTEVYSSPAPFCSHCVKEMIDAQRQTSEGASEDTNLSSFELVQQALSDSSGVIPSQDAAGVQAFSSEHLHHLADLAGSAAQPATDQPAAGDSEGGLQ